MKDQFWLERVYPDAAAAFEHAQLPIESLKNDCLVFIDTNVLLLPYRLDSRSFEEIKKVYKTLADENRLWIPSQVAREFVKNRGEKVRDIVRTLNQQVSSINAFATKKVAFLRGDKDYEEYCALSEKIDEVRAQAKLKIKSISDSLRKGVGQDPVSIAYSKIFAGRIKQTDFAADRKVVLEEMQWRYDHGIPPGYKDREKFDDGIGDLLIWKTILKFCREEARHCIFVTEDAKGDWWVQSEGVFQPRVELIEEFRRETGGLTVHLMPLSEFLELYDASEITIIDTKKTEKENLSEMVERRVEDSRNELSEFSDNFVRRAMLMNLSSVRQSEAQQMIDILRGEARRIASELDGLRAQRPHSENMEFNDHNIFELSSREKALTRDLARNLIRRREIEKYVENFYDK